MPVKRVLKEFADAAHEFICRRRQSPDQDQVLFPERVPAVFRYRDAGLFILLQVDGIYLFYYFGGAYHPRAGTAELFFGESLSAIRGKLDMILTGGDIGTQRGMMLAPDLWRKHVKPYSHKLFNCRNCLFSFNQRGVRRKIGNLELPAGKFSPLKAKLIGEMREALSSKKEATSVLEIIGGAHE